MAQNIKSYNGRSTTSCPNSAEWEAAFGDAENVFGVAITSQLSGSYNAGVLAANEYMEKYPDKFVYRSQENSGQAVARNLALNLCNGEYCVRHRCLK